MKKILIAIEGLDASGKETQTEILYNRLCAEGKRCRMISFPTYDERMSALLKMYLDGEFGTDPDAVNPYVASSFFAVDRVASFMKDWKKDYDDGVIILANRYTTSNAIHQLSKFDDLKEGEKFIDRLYEYEFDLLGLPKPDRVVFLDMPVSLSVKMIEKRCKATGAHKDIHESSKSHLEKSKKAARFAAKHGNWAVVECAPDGDYRLREDIAAEIYDDIKDLI